MTGWRDIGAIGVQQYNYRMVDAIVNSKDIDTHKSIAVGSLTISRALGLLYWTDCNINNIDANDLTRLAYYYLCRGRSNDRSIDLFPPLVT